MKKHNKDFKKLMKLSADLFDAWVALPDYIKHSHDNTEMTRDIHDIQNRILACESLYNQNQKLE